MPCRVEPARHDAAMSGAKERLASPVHEPGRGREADRPGEIPAAGWADIFWRIYSEVTSNHLMLIAAGATYYLLLALFPALGAFVSLYGFVADPKTVADHVAFLAGMLPSASIDLIRAQLQALARQDTDVLSVGFIVGFLVALWSANNGMKALFEAMNIAYGEVEKRSFLLLNAFSMLFTIGAIVIGILLIFTVGVVPAILAVLRLEGWTETLTRILRWPLLFLATSLAITLIYRYGPSRERAKWRWLSWGAVAATFVWMATSIVFSFYLENFADYNATYGTLGAVIGFMVWTWISVIVLIIGAQLNAEIEHQTAIDTTTGAAAPMGERGAVMADTLGPAIAGDDRE